MEKYGVCKTCFDKPTCNQDLKTFFTKTATGDYACPTCGQLVMKQLRLDDCVTIRDDDKIDPDKQ